MSGGEITEGEGSSRGRYIRNTEDIPTLNAIKFCKNILGSKEILCQT